MQNLPRETHDPGAIPLDTIEAKLLFSAIQHAEDRLQLPRGSAALHAAALHEPLPYNSVLGALQKNEQPQANVWHLPVGERYTIWIWTTLTRRTIAILAVYSQLGAPTELVETHTAVHAALTTFAVLLHPKSVYSIDSIDSIDWVLDAAEKLLEHPDRAWHLKKQLDRLQRRFQRAVGPKPVRRAPTKLRKRVDRTARAGTKLKSKKKNRG